MSFVDRVRNAADPRALGALVQRSLKHADRTRAVYPALGELAGRWGGGPDLTASELRVFSQNGEDGVIAEILKRVGTGGGGFVEFGIQDGTEGNTVFLAQVLGWSGVYLEADDASFAALERRYSANPRVRTLHAAVEPDTVEFRYQPVSWRIGWIVSLLALIGLAAAVVVGRRRRART